MAEVIGWCYDLIVQRLGLTLTKLLLDAGEADDGSFAGRQILVHIAADLCGTVMPADEFIDSLGRDNQHAEPEALQTLQGRLAIGSGHHVHIHLLVRFHGSTEAHIGWPFLVAPPAAALY